MLSCTASIVYAIFIKKPNVFTSFFKKERFFRLYPLFLCHPERSEGSIPLYYKVEILRFALDDKINL